MYLESPEAERDGTMDRHVGVLTLDLYVGSVCEKQEMGDLWEQVQGEC